MNSLAPSANKFDHQFASSAHSQGKASSHHQNTDGGTRSVLQDQDDRGSRRLLNNPPSATNVVLAEVSYRVASRTNLSLDTSPQATSPSRASSSTNKNSFDPAAVVKSVMGFIERAASKFDDSEAGSDKLAKLLEQAQEGVLRGVEEATGVLDGLGILDEELSADINEVLAQLQQGISALQQPPVEADSPLSPLRTSGIENAVAGVSESINVTLNLPSTSTRALGNLSQLAQLSAYDVSNQFDLEIRTQEGDVIKVSAAYAAGAEQSSSYTFGTNGAARADYASSQYESLSLAYSVAGDLDEHEISALNDFMEKVAGLADTFYGGDIQAAFDQALALDYDSSEIASFALNLQKQESYQFAEAYQTVAQLPGLDQSKAQPFFDANASIREQLKPLQSFVQEVMKAMEELWANSEESATPSNSSSASAFQDSLAKSLPSFLERAIDKHPSSEQSHTSAQSHFLSELHQKL